MLKPFQTRNIETSAPRSYGIREKVRQRISRWKLGTVFFAMFGVAVGAQSLVPKVQASDLEAPLQATQYMTAEQLAELRGQPTAYASSTSADENYTELKVNVGGREYSSSPETREPMPDPIPVNDGELFSLLSKVKYVYGDTDRLFVVLEVYGNYYFAPGFGQDVTFYSLGASGEREVEVLAPFNFEYEGAPILFYVHAAMTNREMGDLVGNLASAHIQLTGHAPEDTPTPSPDPTDTPPPPTPTSTVNPPSPTPSPDPTAPPTTPPTTPPTQPPTHTPEPPTPSPTTPPTTPPTQPPTHTPEPPTPSPTAPPTTPPTTPPTQPPTHTPPESTPTPIPPTNTPEPPTTTPVQTETPDPDQLPPVVDEVTQEQGCTIPGCDLVPEAGYVIRTLTIAAHDEGGGVITSYEFTTTGGTVVGTYHNAQNYPNQFALKCAAGSIVTVWITIRDNATPPNEVCRRVGVSADGFNPDPAFFPCD